MKKRSICDPKCNNAIGMPNRNGRDIPSVPSMPEFQNSPHAPECIPELSWRAAERYGNANLGIPHLDVAQAGKILTPWNNPHL
jgi:hypothetical protein